MWFDTNSIIEVRKKVQKPWEREDLWAWLFLRRFSIYISIWIATKTNISPNNLTILGMLSGVFAGLSFLIGDKLFLFIGIILYNLAFFLDCVDGEVARLRNATSQLGCWLDIGLRYSLIVSFISFCVGYSNRVLDLAYSNFIIFIVLVSGFADILGNDGKKRSFPADRTKSSKNIRKKNILVDFIIFFTATFSGFYLLMFIFLIIPAANQCMLYWFLLHIITYFLKTVYKCAIVYRHQSLHIR